MTLAEHVTGAEQVQELAADFRRRRSPSTAACAADEIRTLAREIAAAPSAAVYGRIGTSTVEFGTIGSWLVDVINILTGNLDRPGGAMFPLSPVRSGAATTAARPGLCAPGAGTAESPDYPEALSELPAAALAEEIDTTGDGQIKAMITIAGNPVLSAPDGDTA